MLKALFAPIAVAAHAVLFRPPGDGPFPLAVIAHASTQNLLRRAQLPQPECRPLAGWLPERPGHGATGGRYQEDQGGCAEADYARAGRKGHRLAETEAGVRIAGPELDRALKATCPNAVKKR